MNLFENLQLMKESDTSIVSEFKEFLSNKNAQYIANEIGETKDGMQIVIYDGDWKHEHLYMKHLLDEFFTNKGIDISITSEEIGESDQDTFSARYNIIFNSEPKEYNVDVKTEDINNIRYQVTCQLAISNEEIYSEHATLKDAIASARKAQQSFMNVKIKDLEDGNSWYNIDDAEQDLNDGLYEGKHYGGAYDISDTAYFTRDDLDEFSNEVIEQLSNATHGDIIANVVDCYLDEDTNELELTVSYGEYEHTHKEKIDMRKIKVPKDLIKAYSNKFVNDFLWCFTGDTEHEEMIKESVNSSDNSDWEFIEETTTNDEIFGDITEGGYYIKHYNDDMTGIIYPPSESEKLYRAKLTRKNKFNSFGSNVFIELDSAKEFLDTRAYELTSVTYEEIKQQLEEIDTHEYLKIFIDEPTKLGNVSVSIEGTLINGDPITFYDSSYIVNQRDIDFIKEQYAKASKQIDVMRERGYLGVKDESLIPITEDDNELSKTSINDILYRVIWDSKEDEIGKVIVYKVVDIYNNDDNTFIKLKSSDNEIILPLDEDTMSFFIKNKDAAERVARSSKSKNIYFSPNTALDNFDNYVNAKSIKESYHKVEETNHNEILDRDYKTGEKIYNELVEYLDTLDQIAMDGEDCNWEPSEFNAKNLNADGEIYLVSGAYILIYPYINEWAEDYFRVLVVEPRGLQPHIKAGIENVFNMFKTNKWKLVFDY